LHVGATTIVVEAQQNEQVSRSQTASPQFGLLGTAEPVHVYPVSAPQPSELSTRHVSVDVTVTWHPDAAMPAPTTKSNEAHRTTNFGIMGLPLSEGEDG
jgi:hypothetical protein